VTASGGNLAVTVALSHEAAAMSAHLDFPTLRLAGGMVHEVAASALAGGYADTIAYIAGPPIMVDAAIRVLITGGMATRDIRYDKFA
jgi:toluene monooxygenase electron transfer component